MRTTTGTKNRIKQFEGLRAWKRMYVPRSMSDRLRSHDQRKTG